MARYDRSHSILQMTSPLGTDVLIPTSLSGYEAISQPFSYRLRMVSETPGITPDQLLRRPACVILRRGGDEEVRYFHGVFHEFAAVGQARPGMYAYDAVLVPGFWFLSQTIDCRVYQDLTAVEIIQKMLHDAGVDDVDLRIYHQPAKREYTVQFNETDLQFATRLMEETGLFYFFEHTAGKHTLVLADSNDAFKDIPGADLRFNSNIPGEDVLSGWHRPHATTHGLVTLKDYDAAQPGNTLEHSEPTKLDIEGHAARDVFLWHAATDKQPVVQGRTTLIIQAAEAAVSLVHGASSFRALAAGGRVSVDGEDDVGSGGKHVIRWMSFEAADESWSTDGTPAFYANSFEAFPVEIPWRQPFSVPRPAMGSIHAGIVLGPKGEEIHTDKFGRVKILFFWDRRKEATPEKAVWARVVQPWAGNGWGAHFIPRVGSEVAVAFIDGDVDRPIVLGGLYNGEQPPIYPLDQKTRSGFRTRSSPRSGTDHFNELTFDDKAGHELLYVQAQKDLTTHVKHDQALQVRRNRTVDVGNAESIKIGKGRTATIEDKDDKLTVKKGDLSIDISRGKATITAMESIELRVGRSSIRIDPAGVTINGMLIKIDAEGSVTVEAPMVSVSGDAAVKIDGGIVEING